MTSMDSRQPSIAQAVPQEERMNIPNNEPADALSPNPLEKQPGHIPIDPSAIDSHLREIPQKPYTGGSGEETGANLQVPFFPKGFTVSTVLSGNLGEIVDAGGAIPTVGGKEYPEKRALHIEFCNPTYDLKPHHTKQLRVAPTKGAMAIFAAEQIREIINAIPNFPYKLEQIKVLSIDVRSRGTVQPRLFVNGFLMAQQQPDDCLGMMVGEAVAAEPVA